MAVMSAYKAREGSLACPRDASFSSYLDTAERDFVLSLAESIRSPSPGREASTPRVSVGRNRIPRSELGVFGAEKYFNEKRENKKSSTPRREGGGRSHRREKRDDLSERKSSKSTSTIRSSTSSALKSPTPSLRSEASWNSQLGLLALPKKAGVGSRIFSGFQCKGSCFDKKSVHTAATHLSVQSNSPKYPAGNEQCRKQRHSHQDHFAFPIIDTASHNHCRENIKYLGHDQPRKSLEVFGFHNIGKQSIADNLERKLSILAWDAIPNSSPNATFSFPFPSDKSKSTRLSLTRQRDDDNQDARSDASSDLFEIEHLSEISTRGPTSQASEMSSCMTPTATDCYEPSEATIGWSVVTTSATDFSAICNHDAEKITAPAISTTKKISPESGLFVGCTSHTAVEVVENKSHHKIKNNENGRFDLKGSPIIAPSAPSRRSYALAYTN